MTRVLLHDALNVFLLLWFWIDCRFGILGGINVDGILALVLITEIFADKLDSYDFFLGLVGDAPCDTWLRDILRFTDNLNTDNEWFKYMILIRVINVVNPFINNNDNISQCNKPWIKNETMLASQCKDNVMEGHKIKHLHY